MTAVAQGRRVPDTAPWIAKGRGDHFVSLYPVVVPVVIAPLYLPIIPYLNRADWNPLLLDRIARIMEKLCASLLAAASVMLVYLLLRRRADPVTAALLTLVFAFGTTTWVISSQALWMHGLGQLSIAATLLLLTGPCSPWRAVAAGFFCALAACNRQPDAVLAAGLGLYGLWWAGRRIPLFLAAGALPVGLVLAYNLGVVGHVVGAYALAYQPSHVRGDVLANVAGLLFSPTHGLFVFSPFLLFLPFCLPLVLRDRSTRWLTAAIGGAVVLQLIVYGIFVDWRQGISFGPRWLTDMLPMLFWMLPPVVAGLSTAGRVAFGSACGVAIVIQVVGAFWYTGVSDVAVLAAQGPNKMRAAWDIRNASFIAELKHAPAPADLAVNLRGHIDLVALRDKGDDKAEWQIEIQGWTLAGSRSPAAVHVTLDGRLMASTGEFFERPDVVRALGAPGQSGWRLTLPANDLAPGEHAVAVLVQAYVGSEARLLQERTFTAPAGLRGYIDLVAVRETGGDSAERQVEIQGWALAGNRSPAAVQVTVDSRPMGETAEFFERSDVARALGEPSRSGWRFTLPANDLAPGEHSVAVLVRVDEGRKPRLLQERTFTLPADHQTDRRDRELANAARLAAKVLAERQQSSGYWLTWFTDGSV